MKRLLLISILLLAIVGTASATWQIQGSQYTGTIDFYQNGVGIAHVDGYPAITFEYKQVEPGFYEARYLWYSVPFQIKDGIIISENIDGVKLVRV